MTTDSIRKTALLIWQLMNDGATWSYEKLCNTSGLPEREIIAALGWLAREETVEIIQDPVTNEESYSVCRLLYGCI